MDLIFLQRVFFTFEDIPDGFPMLYLIFFWIEEYKQNPNGFRMARIMSGWEPSEFLMVFN